MIHTILIVEDDKKIAKIVKVYLENEGFRVKSVEDAKDAIDFVMEEPPSLVILDLMLPDMSGEELCQELKDIGDFPIIMLTAKSSEEERVAGFALGSDDYIVKPFSPREMVARVKAVMKRAKRKDISFADQMSFNDGILIIDSRSYEIKKNGFPVTMTPTEFKIISVLAGTPGKVFTRSEIVEHALGYKFEGYERSIDAHIKNIRQKIEDDPRNPKFINTVYGVGYKFNGKIDVKKSLG
jgi:two-component system OmpR family response regulator